MSTRNIMKPSSTIQEKSLNSSYDELSYYSSATEEEDHNEEKTGGGDDSSIDSIDDDHPFLLKGRHEPQHYPTVTRPSSHPPFTAMSPESRRKKLLEMDELVSDEEDIDHDARNTKQKKNKTKQSSDDLDDDFMMVDDIDSNSSASEAHNDDRDEHDDYDDDITDESGDDSDSAGGINAHDEYPPDVIHPIRKVWKYSCFSETYRRRMDEIHEEDDEDAEDEEKINLDDANGRRSIEGKEAIEQNKAWSSLDNHQRSWRSQRTVFRNIRMDEGDADMTAPYEGRVLSSPHTVKKHEMLQSLVMEGMVADLSPRSPHERYKKDAHHCVSDDTRGNRPQLLVDPKQDNAVPVVKLLEKNAQNKEAEEEHGLIDSFRSMKRTALLKTKAKASSRKASKKKKKVGEPSKSKPSKPRTSVPSGSKTKTKKAKADGTTEQPSHDMTSAEKKVKKKPKVKSITSSESVTSTSPGSSNFGGEVADLVASRQQSGVVSVAEESVNDSVNSATLASGTVIAEAPLMNVALSGHRIKSSRKSSMSLAPGASVQRLSATIAKELPLKDAHQSGHRHKSFPGSSLSLVLSDELVEDVDAPTIASISIAAEVPLKDDDRSGHSKSTPLRKSMVEAVVSSGAADADASGRSASKSRRKLKGDSKHVGHVVRSSSDATLYIDISAESPSKSRRKLKTEMHEEDKPPGSASKSRRKLRVDVGDFTGLNGTPDHEDRLPFGASRSERNSGDSCDDNDKISSLSASESKRRLKVDLSDDYIIQQKDKSDLDDRPPFRASKSKRRLKVDMSDDSNVAQKGKIDQDSRPPLSASKSKRRLKVEASGDEQKKDSSGQNSRASLIASNSKRRLKVETSDDDGKEQNDKSDKDIRRPRSTSKSKTRLMANTSDDDVIDPKGSRPTFSASNSRRKLKNQIEDDVVEHKPIADQDKRPPFRASNSRRRLRLDNGEDDGIEQNGGTSTTRSSSRSRRKCKSIDDDVPGKSPSQSKRSLRSKRGFSLRELSSVGATEGVNEATSPQFTSSRHKTKSEDSDDFDLAPTASLSPSRTATLRRSMSLDHTSYKGISLFGSTRRLRPQEDTPDTTPLTPLSQKLHSRSRSRSASNSPKPGKSSDLHQLLSMVDIQTPRTPSEQKRHSRSRSRSSSKSPKPGRKPEIYQPSPLIEIFGSPGLLELERSRSDKKCTSSVRSKTPETSGGSGRSATPEKSGSSGRSATPEKSANSRRSAIPEKRRSNGRSATPEKRPSSGRSKTPEKRRSKRSTTPEPLVDLYQRAASQETYQNDDSSSHSSTRKPRSTNRIVVDHPESPNSSRKPRSMNHLGEYAQPPKRKKKPGIWLDAVIEQAGTPTKTKH